MTSSSVPHERTALGRLSRLPCQKEWVPRTLKFLAQSKFVHVALLSSLPSPQS